MTYARINVVKESAYATVKSLGESGLFEFVDVCVTLLHHKCSFSLFYAQLTIFSPSLIAAVKLNAGTNAYLRSYTDRISRCDELDRKLRFFDEYLRKKKIQAEIKEGRTANTQTLEQLEDEISKVSAQVIEFTDTVAKLQEECNLREELYQVLKIGGTLLSKLSENPDIPVCDFCVMWRLTNYSKSWTFFFK